MEKVIRIVLSVVLLGLVALLVYKIVDGIKSPIEYEDQRIERFQTTVDQLILIRSLQDAYKKNVETPMYEKDSTIKGQKVIDTIIGKDTIYMKSKVPSSYENMYTGSFDTLIDFVKNGKIKVVKSIGSLSDEQMKKGLNDKKAIDMIVKAKSTNDWKEVDEYKLSHDFCRDTTYVSVQDSLCKNIGYPIDSLRYIRVGKKTKFNMATAKVMTGSGVEVRVFQCYALYDDILDGLDRQLTVNYKDKVQDTCLRVGSLEEANTSGNWDATMESKKQE